MSDSFYIESVHRYDTTQFDNFADAEKAAKINALRGYEYAICKEVARVLPSDNLTVTVQL